MQYFIGCSGFYNKDWKEIFYPKGLPQSKWFEFYCTQFNTLELNTTFYRFPTIEMLQKWYDNSPAGFKFSVKAPRLITHYKQFNEVESLLNDFYVSVHEGLKEKLATILFQLPARIEYSEEFLQRITQNLDSNFKNVIEFRHISWWNQFVYDELAKHNIAFCGISIKNLPAEIIANTSNIYYRFHGIKKLYFSEYNKQTIKSFANELTEEQNIQEAYIYFNNTATIAAVNNARQLVNFLKRCNDIIISPNTK
ncbi:MAG TPA: DUF72 domain-containing protein [Parafilimonas sp.]|nr:DUF72 domain-containing protein [Parafilimonas sp.]